MPLFPRTYFFFKGVLSQRRNENGRSFLFGALQIWRTSSTPPTAPNSSSTIVPPPPPTAHIVLFARAAAVPLVNAHDLNYDARGMGRIPGHRVELFCDFLLVFFVRDAKRNILRYNGKGGKLGIARKLFSRQCHLAHLFNAHL